MAYSQTIVVLGGLAHVPIVIGLLGAFDRRTSKSYHVQKAALAAAKAKEKAQAKAKAEEEAKARAKAESILKSKKEEKKATESKTEIKDKPE